MTFKVICPAKPTNLWTFMNSYSFHLKVILKFIHLLNFKVEYAAY